MDKHDCITRRRVGESEIEIGRFTYGADTMEIKQWGEGASLRIGAFCSIAAGLVVFLGGNHRTDWATTYPFGHVFRRSLRVSGIEGHPATRGDVVVGNDVWIGANVTLMSGVTVGDGAVIGANATVSRNIRPYEIWGGNPAVCIRPRFPDDLAARLQALAWWTCRLDVIAQIAPLLSRPPTHAILDDIARIIGAKT